MMTLDALAWLPAVMLVLLILVQAAYVLNYKWHLAADILRPRPRDFQPPVTVLLCLRGQDPSLQRCLSALLNQDYRQYKLICILDSPEDPAFPFLTGFEDDPRFSVQIASAHSRTCSLKCNSLVTAMSHVQDTVTVLVDADTEVDPHWLSDLVAPLERSDVVASSANRWFLPPDERWGSLVRYFWNMAAAPQMYVYQVTWGGSLALKTDFLRDSGLLDAWSRSLFEDASVPSFARRLGKTVVMVPSLLIPNRESASLAGTYQWMQRQLLDTRLYHSCFPLVVGHAFLVALALIGSLLAVGALVGLGQDNGLAVALFASGLLYGVFYIWAWRTLERTARKALRQRGHAVPDSLPIGWRRLVAVGITQAAYTLATFHALLTRRVTWRGISYAIQGPFEIRREAYQRMRPSDASDSNSI